MERFGFEGFDVFDYGAELWSLADDIARRIRPERRHLADQLERASHSIVLNIAEATGRYSPGAKANAYRIARGSANETAAIFVLLERKGLISEAEATHARRLLLSIIAMLSRLAINFERKAFLARPGNVGHNPRKLPAQKPTPPRASQRPQEQPDARNGRSHAEGQPDARNGRSPPEGRPHARNADLQRRRGRR